MKQPSHFNDLSMLRSQTPSHLQTRSVAPSIRLLAGNYTLNLGVMHFSPELHHIAAWPQVLWHSRIRLTRSNSDPVMMLSSQSLGRWQIPHMPKSKESTIEGYMSCTSIFEFEILHFTLKIPGEIWKIHQIEEEQQTPHVYTTDWETIEMCSPSSSLFFNQVSPFILLWRGFRWSPCCCCWVWSPGCGSRLWQCCDIRMRWIASIHSRLIFCHHQSNLRRILFT